MNEDISNSIKLIEGKYANQEDDDGFAKWMAEDDRIKPTAPVTQQTLFRVPTPRANTRRVSTPRSSSRPTSRDSVKSVISSEGNSDESSEDFLTMDPLAAQALKDLKEALGLAVQVEDFMSASTLKKIEPKI